MTAEGTVGAPTWFFAATCFAKLGTAQKNDKDINDSRVARSRRAVDEIFRIFKCAINWP
jgi:hypothetical protein